jgi:hypothetical protein
LKLRKHGGVFWPGDYVKRAGAVMKESRSTDLFVLARIALEAAIRNESDLAELVRPEPASGPQFTAAQTFPVISCPPSGRRAAASHVRVIRTSNA